MSLPKGITLKGNSVTELQTKPVLTGIIGALNWLSLTPCFSWVLAALSGRRTVSTVSTSVRARNTHLNRNDAVCFNAKAQRRRDTKGEEVFAGLPMEGTVSCPTSPLSHFLLRVSAPLRLCVHPCSPRTLSRCARLAFAVFFSLAAGSGLAADKPAAASEYQLKAAFLFNFVKFTDWPSSAFTNSSTAPLVIAVLGSDPFGSALDEVVKGETINGRPIVLRRFQDSGNASACHVLFVSRAEKDRLPALLETLKKKPILTVSDLDQFCQQGGMINLALSASGTVKPEINPDAARAASLQISSKLLNLPMVKLVKTER